MLSSSSESFMQVKFKGKVSKLQQVFQLGFKESKEGGNIKSEGDTASV
jgi:hypothetical protein